MTSTLKLIGLVPPLYIVYDFNPEASWFSRFPRFTEGTGLHELHVNSSCGAAKSYDCTGVLATYDNVGGSWVNISDAGIVNKPPANGYTRPAYDCLTEGTGLHDNSSGAAKSDGDTGVLATYDYVGGHWVNISDAGIVNNSPGDCGLNKPSCDGKKPTDGRGGLNGKSTTVQSMGTAAGAHKWNCKERSGESQAAWETSTEKETGGWDSCGYACYTCGDADHFSRKCNLGADCGGSGHASGGNSTISYIV